MPGRAQGRLSVPRHPGVRAATLNSDDSLAATICEGAAAFGLALAAGQADLLARYLMLLAKWNRIYNLTGIGDAPAMVAPHVLDSLSVLKFVRGARVLDVGSGAGLPGIPLAIANPDKSFVLLDSNSKKTRFMQQAAIELDLANVHVEHRRIQSYRPEVGFDTVICRAFASLTKFVAAARTCAPTGRMLAMKGVLRESEQQELRAMRGQVNIYKLEVPGIDGPRQLLEIYNA
jgi:16S rRNA (guanine527-N7)-methyltransferase